MNTEKGCVEIQRISEEVIEVMGITYYKEDYLKEMIRRTYEKGIKEGQQIHIARFENPIFPEETIREKIKVLFKEKMYAFHPSIIDSIVKIIKETKI